MRANLKIGASIRLPGTKTGRQSRNSSSSLPGCTHLSGRFISLKHLIKKSTVILSDRSVAQGVEGPAAAFLPPLAPSQFSLATFFWSGIFLFALHLPTIALAQSPVVLDKVVAVVNRHAILASDIDDEIRLSVLDPANAGQGELTRQHALDQLISRSLIEQQIRREDAEAAEPSHEEVNARLTEIRKELPACIRQNCASDAGWKAFLAAHDLTPQRVDAYLSYRLEILAFIEERFKPGIHIAPQDIETYYRTVLLPQYPAGEPAPSLEKVSPRIEEILLQQQVTILFDDWLANLRKQGDVEVLDPAFESPTVPAEPAPAPVAQPSVGHNGEGKGDR